MGSTWKHILDEFNRVCFHDFRDDNDREEAVLDQMEFTIRRILEKLRDAEGIQ